MTEELWQAYEDRMNAFFINQPLFDQPVYNQKSIDDIWDLIKQLIGKSTQNIILIRKISTKCDSPTHKHRLISLKYYIHL